MSCHSLLICRVSAERSDKLMGFCLFVFCLFSFAVTYTVSLSLFYVILITMCLGMFLLGFILPGTLCTFWTWVTVYFSMLRKSSSNYLFQHFLRYFLSSPSQTPRMLLQLTLPLKSLVVQLLLQHARFACTSLTLRVCFSGVKNLKVDKPITTLEKKKKTEQTENQQCFLDPS